MSRRGGRVFVKTVARSKAPFSAAAMTSFLAFLAGFKIVDGRYAPADSCHNRYRHYGTQCPALVLNYEEVLHLFDPDVVVSNRGAVMYFKLKNSGLNAFRFEDRTDKYFVYVKTAEFNRKKALPAATSEIVGKNDEVAPKLGFFEGRPQLFCVCSGDQMSFVKIAQITELSRACDRDFYKNRHFKGKGNRDANGSFIY